MISFNFHYFSEVQNFKYAHMRMVKGFSICWMGAGGRGCGDPGLRGRRRECAFQGPGSPGPRAEAQRSQVRRLLNTPRGSPRGLYSRPKNTLFPQDQQCPLGAWRGGGLRMPWWASGPPAAPRDSTPPSSQAVVPLLRARGASRVPAALESITLKQ